MERHEDENAPSERSLSRRRFAKSLGVAALGTAVGAPLVGAARAKAEGTLTTKEVEEHLPASVVQSNQENTFTKAQTIRPTSANDVGLKILSDNRAGTLVIGNVTSEQNPANTPGFVLQKDNTNRWELSIDATAGPQGDFSFYSFTGSADIIYVTDERSPGVGIGATDRYAARSAQLRIDNISASRPTLIVNPAQAGTTKPAILIYRHTEKSPNVLEIRDASLETLIAYIDNKGSFITTGELSISGKVGFNGVRPVAKAAAIASPAAELAALKTAVDALRTVVKNVGLSE
jgi:hypothetical protein